MSRRCVSVNRIDRTIRQSDSDVRVKKDYDEDEADEESDEADEEERTTDKRTTTTRTTYGVVHQTEHDFDRPQSTPRPGEQTLSHWYWTAT